MEIIDVHTHTPVPGDLWETYLKEMRANGITICFTSTLGVKNWPQFPTSAEIREANDLSVKFSAYAEGMVFWLAYLNPQNPDAMEELERCVKLGCRGVKLWVSLKDEKTGSLDKCFPILKRAGELGLVVKIHTFQRTAGNLPGEVTMADAVTLAQQFPQTKIIAAHTGANWRMSHGALRRLPNLYVDICGSIPQAGFVESLCKWIPVSHILYGSDALGRSFPSQIAKVTCADIPDKDKRSILFGNAMRLFNITNGELEKARAKAATIPLPSYLDSPKCDEDFTFIIGLPGDQIYTATDLDKAIAIQQQYGIKRRYAANGNSIFSTDLITTNAAFKKLCSRRKSIVPLATLMPRFINWHETIEEAVRQGFQGAILFPYLHNWNLADNAYRAFFETCANSKLPLWISTVVYDYRFHHPATSPRPVATKEILAFLENAPKNQYIIQGLNASDTSAVLKLGNKDVKLDIARLVDGTDALRKVVKQFGCKQLVFGSEYPIRPPQLNREILATLCLNP